MPSLASLDVQLLPEVRDLFKSFMSKVPDAHATLCLIKGRMENDPHESWVFGAYSQNDIAELEHLGQPILYTIEGFLVAIPDKADELAGKVIGWADGHLVVQGQGM